MNIRSNVLLSSLIALLLLVASGPRAGAQTAMYLKFEALFIKGGVVRPSYQDSLEVLSYSFGAFRSVTVSPGGVNASGPSLSELTITAPFDAKAYAGLVKESLTGTERKIGVLHIVVGSEDSFTPLAIEIDGIISNISTSQSAGDDGGGFMAFGITITKVKIITSTPNAQGGTVPGIPFTWDAKTSTGS